MTEYKLLFKMGNYNQYISQKNGDLKRIYELPFEIPYLKGFNNIPSTTKYVMVSDSVCCCERLVFPIFTTDGSIPTYENHEFDSLHIGGLSRHSDSVSDKTEIKIYPDEHYLKELINKYRK